MELKQFQCFIIGSLFGWVDDLGNRRFTKAYISMARKNGKTLLLAGIAMHDLLLGKEPKFERTVGVVSHTQKQATLFKSRSPFPVATICCQNRCNPLIGRQRELSPCILRRLERQWLTISWLSTIK